MNKSWLAAVVIAGCADEKLSTPFTPAQVSVDSSKSMSALTADEQATLCSELTTSLTASFGTPKVSCQLGSLSGTRAGTSGCEDWYGNCLVNSPAMTTVNACTPMNTDMFQCAITVGQYTACFNATNAYLLRTIESVHECSTSPPTAQATADEMAACANAQCDYLWVD